MDHLKFHLFSLLAAGMFLSACMDDTPPCDPATEDPFTSLTDSLRSSLQWPEDLVINVFSGPDLTPSPACMAVAPTGEVYVGVDMIGSLGKEMGMGKIVRFVDCNQDGIPDEYTIFAELDDPRGIIAMDNKVFVLHTTFSPETKKADGMDLVVLEDLDGDGVADGPAQPLVENICSAKFLRERGTDHSTNGIRMGIDGWIYIAVGDFGFTDAVDREGTTLTLLGGGIVRVRPDGTEMEIYTTGMRNIYDVAIDPFMNIFTRGNTNDGGGWNIRFSHHIQSGVYGYPMLFKNFTEEILPGLVDLGGGSGTGALYMDDDRWPQKYDRVPLMADWGRNYLYRHPLKADRGSFTQSVEEFIQLPQITDVDIDGAGIMYLSAWDGAGYSGSSEKGFTVRVVPEGFTPRPFRSLQGARDKELISILQSGSGIARQYASYHLVNRGGSSLAEQVWKLAEDVSMELEVRVAALYTYAQMARENGLDKIAELAGDETMLEHVLRVMTDRLDGIEKVDPGIYIAALHHDDDRIKNAAIIGLGRMGDQSAVRELLKIEVPASFMAPEFGMEGNHATPNSEIIPAHLAVQSLVRLGAVEELLDAVEESRNPLAMWALRYIHDSRVPQRLIAWYESETDPEFRKEVLALLARLYHKEAPYDSSWWWGTRPDTRGPYYVGIEWDASPQIRDFLVQSWRTSDRNEKEYFKLLNTKFRLGVDQFGTLEKAEEVEDAPLVDLEKIRNREGQIGKTSIEDVMLALDQIKGDIEEGRELFVRQGCQTCHNLERSAVMKGPYMGQIGSIMNRHQIAESILKPSASISQGFGTVQIRTRDEKIYVGFVTEETADNLVIRNIAGEATRLEKSNIQERKELESSMMPAGLANSLSFQQFASLVDFLKDQTE